MNKSNLQTLMELEGYDDLEHFLSDIAHEGAVPAICTQCKEFTEYLEPDARAIKCCSDCHDGGSVTSGLVLAGVI